MKNDLNVKRVKAFVKRLVQILGLHQPSFVVGVFYLIRELEKIFPGLQSLVDQPEENDDDDEEVFRDVPDEDDQEATVPTTDGDSKKQNDAYDPRKRDPEHSNADKSCLWELVSRRVIPRETPMKNTNVYLHSFPTYRISIRLSLSMHPISLTIVLCRAKRI